MYYIDPSVGSLKYYIDPGIWSLVVQVLIGLLLAIPIFLKLSWAKVKKFVKRKDE